MARIIPDNAGIKGAAIGIGATLISKMLSTRTWTIQNNDNLERIEGQFPANGVTREVGTNWVEINSLNRQNPILQFISGKSETLQIQSMFFRRDQSDETIEVKINKLISWTKRDQRRGRPPILTFWIGDGTVVTMGVIIEGISGIQYSKPNFFGGIRQVNFTLNLRQYTKFSLTDTEVTDTRYHRTKEGQYYELIAEEEYGNPMLGDVVRKLDFQIGKHILKPGDIVKLPAVEGVRSTKVTQQSNILKTAYGNKDTVQRRLRMAYFTGRNIPRNTFFPVTPQPITLPLTGGIFDFTFDESFE